MPIHFRKVQISDERYESAGVFDVDGDGVPDIVSGAWWYQGPDFTRRHPIGAVAAHDEYYDDFSTIALDIDGDGRLDFVTGGWWGNTLRWRCNPGRCDAEWEERVIATCGNIETSRAWDLDGDGILELVPNCPGGPLVAYKLDTDAQGRGRGSFTAHVLRSEAQGHGLGCGDISGSGRGDIVLRNGWLEAPADRWHQAWTWHPDFDLGVASVPILVADVNGNGLSDLIVGQAHDYGLSWYEQRLVDGQRQWIHHPIDPWNSQYHDMQWVDIDGDGQCELVTGKRWRAHCGRDPGADDPVGIYYFKWNGEHFVKQVIGYGPVPRAAGCGIHLAIADLTGDGRLDLVAPGKDGLHVFYNEGSPS